MSQQHILITGAAKGIGRAAALHLARNGFHVYAGVRSAADGDQLRDEAGSNLTPIQLDVTDSAQIAQAARQISQTDLYGLVNNAGIAVAAPLEFVPIDDFRRQIEVNLVAQVAVTQAFIPCLRQSRGRIINITSIGGRVAGGMLGAYHASKFALEAITDALRQELARWHIEVVAVEPGMIATPIWDTSAAAFDKLMQRMNPAVNDLYRKAIDASLENARQANTRGIPPERVAAVIHTALTAPRPQTRYLVGMDAHIAGHIFTRVPDRLRDRLMAAR